MYSQPWSPRAGVPDAEALARLSVDEYLARRRAVGDHVARDGVALRRKRRALRGPYGDDAAGERLADVVVRLANEVERDALREKRAERLARDAGKVDG